MRMSMSHRLEHRQSLRLSTDQKLEVGHRMIQIRMELAESIHGRRYNQKGVCPKCGRTLTSREILEGFIDHPTDTTTECPQCTTRFQPKLVSLGIGSSIEVSFMCSGQVLHALRDQDTKKPDEIARYLPSVFQSAVLHFGSLRAAFKRLGEKDGTPIDYPHEDFGDWKTKVRPFLGQLPDTHIAEIVGVSKTTIGNMRREQGITRYRASDYA